MTLFYRSLILGTSALALAGCDADEIISPGTGGDIIVNPPATPAPTPAPTPGPGTGTVTPAAGCPTIADPQGLTNSGTIEGPTGEYRICTLPATFNVSSTLPQIDGVLYALNGRVDVGTDGGPVASAADSNVTLTIEPGVIVYAATGRSALVVNRGNQIQAVGAQDRPIIFTSRDNVQGIATDASIAQWGGVILLGRARVSDCSTGAINPADPADCQQEVEGFATQTQFGGADDADSSGRMSYVQLRYSGFALEADNELQSLTTGGVGSGTELDNIMSFNSSDDGVEFFGGTVNVKNLIVVGADDDSIDVDTGAQANLQYVIAVQRSAGGDSIVELDSPDGDFSTDARPQTNLQISNFTFVERSNANSQAVRLRGGADFALVNGIIDTAGETCFRIDEAETIAADPTFESVVADCDQAAPLNGTSGVTAADIQAEINEGANNNLNFTPTLTMTFVNGSNENAVPVFDPTALSTFFDTPSNIGAVFPGNDDWVQGWTCNSAIVTFDGAVTACTALPVYS